MPRSILQSTTTLVEPESQAKSVDLEYVNLKVSEKSEFSASWPHSSVEDEHSVVHVVHPVHVLAPRAQSWQHTQSFAGMGELRCMGLTAQVHVCVMHLTMPQIFTSPILARSHGDDMMERSCGWLVEVRGWLLEVGAGQ